ncbi:MAG: carbohydrate porin [Bacteroidota bacterium]
MKNFVLIILYTAIPAWVLSQVKTNPVSNWTTHFQTTIVYQHQNSFAAKYSGQNSLDTNANEAYSQTSTFYFGRKLWKGASFYLNPEIAGGTGISHVVGLAGATNGETYKVGNPTPTMFIARGYLQQIIPLGNAKNEYQADGVNQLADSIPASRLVFSAGKFCIADFFDDNTYNHDARSQFLNWSIMAHGAWDFPADVRGYTSGIVVELIKPTWSLRFAAVRVPLLANGLSMDWTISKANSETLELEKKWTLHKRPGAVRATTFITFSRAPEYKSAINDLKNGDSTRLLVLTGKKEWDNYEGRKVGFAINIEQEIANGIGMFARYSWSDGHSGAWAFTEVDRNFQLGISVDGKLWKRKDDVLGFCVAVNGLAPDHKAYLEAGGMGFIIGDGKLNYGTENILEAFYRTKITPYLYLSADFQFITNPAYNKDRSGPIYVPGIRAHVEL